VDAVDLSVQRPAMIGIAGRAAVGELRGMPVKLFTPADYDGVVLALPSDTVPGWIGASGSRVDITTEGGRATLTKARTQVMRYAFGRELFGFTLDSPFYAKRFGKPVGLAVSGERVAEGKSNIAAILHDIRNTPMRRHKDDMRALFAAVLMAFLGTMGAALVALPLRRHPAAGPGGGELLPRADPVDGDGHGVGLVAAAAHRRG